MISKYGQTFASMAEVRRFEQVKPETVRLWEAFEAMRVALRAYLAVTPHCGEDSCKVTRCVNARAAWRDAVSEARAALALADKVAR